MYIMEYRRYNMVARENIIALVFLMGILATVTTKLQTQRYHIISSKDLNYFHVTFMRGYFPTYLSCAVAVSKSGLHLHGYRRRGGQCVKISSSSSPRKFPLGRQWRMYSPMTATNGQKGRTMMTSKRKQKRQRPMQSRAHITRTPDGTDVVFMTTNGYVCFYDLDKNRPLFESNLRLTSVTQMLYMDSYLRVVSGGRVIIISPFSMKSRGSKKEPGLLADVFDVKTKLHVLMTKDKITIRKDTKDVTKTRSKSVSVLNAFEMRLLPSVRAVLVASWVRPMMCIAEITYSGQIRSSIQIRSKIPGTFRAQSGHCIYVCNERGAFVVKRRGDGWKASNIQRSRCWALDVRFKLIWIVLNHPPNHRQLLILSRNSNQIKQRFPLRLPTQLKDNMVIQSLEDSKTSKRIHSHNTYPPDHHRGHKGRKGSHHTH